ncbi:MAG: phytoene dehydrogenase, partial [Opitutaceae bacterium]
VQRIEARAGRAHALVLDDGTEVTARHVISSIGAPETERLISGEVPPGCVATPAGRLSFVETITVLNREPAAFGWGGDTIVFFNDSERFHYESPQADVDTRSGVICLPNNFEYGAGKSLPEGLLRVTCLARPEVWSALPEEAYRAAKQRWFMAVQESARRFLPPCSGAVAPEDAVVATDMFTPRTITRYTGHLAGAIYGSPVKNRHGRTALDNLYLCGTDQGFLGIIGAMLSGISMANLHVLQKETSRS